MEKWFEVDEQEREVKGGVRILTHAAASFVGGLTFIVGKNSIGLQVARWRHGTSNVEVYLSSDVSRRC